MTKTKTKKSLINIFLTKMKKKEEKSFFQEAKEFASESAEVMKEVTKEVVREVVGEKTLRTPMKRSSLL